MLWTHRFFSLLICSSLFLPLQSFADDVFLSCKARGDKNYRQLLLKISKNNSSTIMSEKWLPSSIFVTNQSVEDKGKVLTQYEKDGWTSYVYDWGEGKSVRVLPDYYLHRVLYDADDKVIEDETPDRTFASNPYFEPNKFFEIKRLHRDDLIYYYHRYTRSDKTMAAYAGGSKQGKKREAKCKVVDEETLLQTVNKSLKKNHKSEVKQAKKWEKERSEQEAEKQRARKI